MKKLTFQQIFTGRIVLNSALRHIAQQHGCYCKAQALHFHPNGGAASFVIIHQCLTELESEFSSKKRRMAA